MSHPLLLKIVKIKPDWKMYIYTYKRQRVKFTPTENTLIFALLISPV